MPVSTTEKKTFETCLTNNSTKHKPLKTKSIAILSYCKLVPNIKKHDVSKQIPTLKSLLPFHKGTTHVNQKVKEFKTVCYVRVH